MENDTWSIETLTDEQKDNMINHNIGIDILMIYLQKNKQDEFHRAIYEELKVE